MNEEAPNQGNQNIVRQSSEAVAAKGPSQIVNMEKLADEFALICSADLEKDLTPEKIIEQLIQKGFPSGLASYLGASLLERIADARQTLAVAATKPKLKDSLVATVKEEVIEYFKSREAEILRFFEVSSDPVGYLEMTRHIFS